MSVEAPTMSGGPAISPAIGTNGSPSFGGEVLGHGIGAMGIDSVPGATIDSEGINNPGLNNNALFSQTTELVPSMESFDKVVPGNLAFTHTKVLWQAPSPLNIPEVEIKQEVNFPINNPTQINLDNDVFPEIPQGINYPTSEPEIILSPIDRDIVADISPIQTIEEEIGEIAQAEPVSDLEPQVSNFIQEATDNKLISDTLTIPEIEQREIVADAKQAIKVEEALIAVGSEEEEAHKTALKVFAETEIKKGLTSTSIENKAEQAIDQKLALKDEEKVDIKENKAKPPEFYFVHDTKADEARIKTAARAVAELTQEIADGKREILTGYDIVEHMPDPQPQDMKSEIAKNRDGSLKSFDEQLKATGKLSSASEAVQVINKIKEENHAVKIANIPSAQEATEKEVKKVSSE